MKIKIFDRQAKEIFSGDFCYAEGGFEDKKKTKPGFHIDINGEDNNGKPGHSEVHFFCESMDEFNEFLQDIKESIEED